MVMMCLGIQNFLLNCVMPEMKISIRVFFSMNVVYFKKNI